MISRSTRPSVSNLENHFDSFKIAEIPRTKSKHFFKVGTLFNHLLGIEFAGSIEDNYVAAYILPVSPSKEDWTSFCIPEENLDTYCFPRVTQARELSVLSKGSERPLLAEGSLCITDPPKELAFKVSPLKYALVSYVIPPIYHSQSHGCLLLGRGIASFLLRSLEEYSRSHELELIGAKILKSNIASINLAMACGFQRGPEIENSVLYYKQLSQADTNTDSSSF